MTSHRNTWLTLMFVMAAFLPIHPARSQRSLLPISQIALATFDRKQGYGTIYVREGGAMKPLFRDRHVLTLPVISPDGLKVAFNRFVDPDVADAELVVIDMSGKVLSSILINDDPAHNNYFETPNIVKLEWMGNTRVEVTGIFNPTVNIGYVVPLRPSSLEHPSRLGSSPGDLMLDDEGPSEVSPSGRHVVTVTGLSQGVQYTSCGSDGQLSAREVLEIDGIDLPAGPKNMVVVAPFSWRDDDSFSTVIRSNGQFDVLTASGLVRLPYTDQNTPTLRISNVTLTPIPLAPAELNAASFEGFYTAAGYQLRQYMHNTGTVSSNWFLSSGRMERVAANAIAADPKDARTARSIAESISGDMRSLTDLAHIDVNTIVSVNVACTTDVRCGTLANQPASNALMNGIGVKVPDVCMPQ